MQEITRNEFLVKTGNILKNFLIVAVLGFLAYLAVTLLVGLTANGWKLAGLVIAILIALKFTERFFKHIETVYISRSGEGMQANIAGLKAFSDFICTAILGAMAMKSYFHQRFDNVIMWCCLMGYFAWNSYRKAKQNALNKN